MSFNFGGGAESEVKNFHCKIKRHWFKELENFLYQVKAQEKILLEIVAPRCLLQVSILFPAQKGMEGIWTGIPPAGIVFFFSDFLIFNFFSRNDAICTYFVV